MTIRTKIALQFSVIVAALLAVFSIGIYYLSENYRQQEFYNSLRDRAVTTARLLIKEPQIDKQLLKVIDKNTLTTLYPAQVLVFNDSNQVAYYNYEADTIYYSPELLNRIRSKRYIETTFGSNQVVGTMYSDTLNKSYAVLAQAEDVYGKEKLMNIREAMYTGYFSAIILTIILGFVFAGQSLKPISKINEEISHITASSLRKKLDTGNNTDEIATLAVNFNKMLSRLDSSFELQKSFVSNASHELRTPLAAVKSEIQVALQNERTPEEYKTILNSLLNDNQRLIKLTNSLLQLAKSEAQENTVNLRPIRIDEILFDVQDEILHLNPNYKIQIDFEDIPEDINWVTVNGKEALLKTLFTNLIDNACKYSQNQQADVRIKANNQNCLISVSDTGIGIQKEELEKVFEPFYRTSRATSYKGSGIGLSICKRIVDLHQGKISLKSEVDVGSLFVVILPHT
ncbi:sensor histidine kinase [Arcticibacterium luteifluviistationis]|uniref:histidine kinase n=1 Tax=Arcticibacterium luteifluviistationis TaxID=1784714 RepID=A0A2Z4G777_9BACT|nr:HAMP domain-containing sensor histidine kinase [Arcticibacterium luteifluviistationis]AWV96933.1 sensor histidine kinase [Arcticibacterium luteifluviistationis]